jgi:colicin import membrane protein
MVDRYPSAVALSALIHGAIVALLILLAYVTEHQTREPVKVFELVAGEGDNFGATEAPALGKSGGVKLEMPAQPVAQSKPQSAPVVSAPEPAPLKVVDSPPTKAADKAPDFTKDLNRIAVKREARVEAKFHADEARKAKEEAAKKAKDDAAKAKMSKAEFDKLNAGKTTPIASTNPPKIARIDAEGIAKGVAGGSTNNKTGGAGGKALSREAGNEQAAWEAMLKQRMHDALEKPSGVSDTLVAIAEVNTAADGTLSRARIAESSGSPDFDQAVLGAIGATHMPPRPDGKSEQFRMTFRMHEVDN